MKLDKKIRYQGGLWNEILPESNKSMAEEGFVILHRPASIHIMRKQGGQMVGGIDCKPGSLKGRNRQIAEKVHGGCNLEIKSLHDAQADCTCGWSCAFTGEMTRGEIISEWLKH